MTINYEDSLYLKTRLKRHSGTEKHVGYHILPERVDRFFSGTERQNKYIFHERERFSFIKKYVDFADKSVVDIGCNVGYFLFNALDAGASDVTGYEGKESCGEFLREAIKVLDELDRFRFFNEYYEFSEEKEAYDIGFLLNVVHHLGDDYGSCSVSKMEAKNLMVQQLNSLSYKVETLIFQMGFNWKGDRHNCLFTNGTKDELIQFIREGTNGYWNIEGIGIPEQTQGVGISYQGLNNENIKRDDALGEFLNRPLFIMRSAHLDR